MIFFLICLFLLFMVAPVMARNFVGGCLLIFIGLIGILAVILFLNTPESELIEEDINYQEREGRSEDVGEEPPLVAEQEPEPDYAPERPIPLSEWGDYRSDMDPKCVDAIQGYTLAQRAWGAGQISDEDMRRISIEAYDLCTDK